MNGARKGKRGGSTTMDLISSMAVTCRSSYGLTCPTQSATVPPTSFAARSLIVHDFVRNALKRCTHSSRQSQSVERTGEPLNRAVGQCHEGGHRQSILCLKTYKTAESAQGRERRIGPSCNNSA